MARLPNTWNSTLGPSENNIWGDLLNKFLQVAHNSDGTIISGGLGLWVNVKDSPYNAKGDGVTDDTSAIQTAINAATVGTVYFPAGVYKVTSTITISNGVRLIGLGTGPGAVLTLGLSTGYYGSVIEHNFSGDLFQVKGVSGFVELGVGTTFENLLLRQVAGNGSSSQGRAIVAIGTSDSYKPSWIHINRVTTETGTGKDDWQWGVYLDGSLTSGFSSGGIRDTWIRDCRFNSGTNGTGNIFCDTIANLFITNVELNGTATSIQLTGADAAHASTGAFLSNVNTNGSMTLTRASNVMVAGGSLTSVTISANCSKCQIYPNMITNTPSQPPGGTNSVIAAYFSALGKRVVMTDTAVGLEFDTPILGLKNGTAASIGTLDAQNLNFLTNGTTNVSITSAGLLQTGKGISVTGGSGFSSGNILMDSAQGLSLVGVTGSSNDLNLLSATGASTLVIPTGTSGVKLPSSTAGLQVGSAPTGGDKGAGTINIATADGFQVNGTSLKAISETLTNKTITAPVLSGTATGTYTLGGTSTIASPTLSGTVTGTYTLGGTPTISSPIINGTPTGTGIPTLTVKSGSGAGDYTTSSATYVDIDATNLTYTVTIPTNWKLHVTTVATVKHSTLAATVGYAIFDTQPAAVVVEQVIDQAVAGDREALALTHVITGDGNAHTVKVQWKTSGATATMSNSSSTFTPKMTFILSPSN